jgi:excisionase family DNA binding protein
MKEFMTMKEVAELLRVHPVTINRYCKQGKLTYYQVGCRKRFVKEDIDNYLEGEKCHAKENSENPFSAD